MSDIWTSLPQQVYNKIQLKLIQLNDILMQKLKPYIF